MLERASNFAARTHRIALLICAALLIIFALIAWLAVVAAVVATGLFALDPNFLAHAPIVKNDVVFSLAMLGLCFALWRAGQRLTWPRAIAVALLCVAMLGAKFSGILAGVLVPVLL